MNRRPAALAAAVLLTLSLAACSDDDSESAADPSPAATPTSSPPTEAATPAPSASAPSSPAPEPEGRVLEIEVSGDRVTPNAAKLELDRGEPLTLRIVSDREGELHVHSRPEQYVEFGAGPSEQELVIEAPGSVEVEEHESGVVVAIIRVGG